MTYNAPTNQGFPTAPPGWYPDATRTGWIWWDGYRYVGPDSMATNGASDVATVSSTPTRTWFPEVPSLPFPAAILGIEVMVVLTVLSRANEALPQAAAAVISLVLLLPSTIGLPMAAWYASRRWGTRHFLDDMGFRFAALDIPLAVAGVVVLTIGLIVINATLMALGAPPGSNLTDFAKYGRSIPIFIMLFVTAGIVAPFTEEIMFRGLIMRGLSSRLSGWWPVVVQGVIFGFAHFTPSEGWGNITLIVSLGALGVGLGAIAKLTGRLGAGIATHAIFNCLQLTLLWFTIEK